MATDRLSEEEFADYLFEVRRTAMQNLTELRTINRDALPPDARTAFDAQVEGWLQIVAMTEPEAVADHLLAAEMLGRELTLDESRALLLRQ
jgi:hypothetical protein